LFCALDITLARIHIRFDVEKGRERGKGKKGVHESDREAMIKHP